MAGLQSSSSPFPTPETNLDLPRVTCSDHTLLFLHACKARDPACVQSCHSGSPNTGPLRVLPPCPDLPEGRYWEAVGRYEYEDVQDPVGQDARAQTRKLGSRGGNPDQPRLACTTRTVMFHG